MEAVPCPVIGITGSAGKTTTTTLVGRMAQAAVQAPDRVWVGGNIGLPLIDHLDEIPRDDLVMLELSSFQLELMTRSPQVAAVLNITPNHLDRHGTMAAYTAAKARILAFQSKAGHRRSRPRDPGSWGLSGRCAGRLVSFGFQRPAAGQTGTFVENERVVLQDANGEQALFSTDLIRLRGQHNLLNVLAACAIAYAAGFPPAAMAAGVEGFNGVPTAWNGCAAGMAPQWYNNSIATAPERTMAAIRSFNEPLVLLLGGRDKNLPWDELADLVHQRVDHVVVFGEAAPKILQALGPQQDRAAPFHPGTVCRIAGSSSGAAGWPAREMWSCSRRAEPVSMNL